MYMKKKHCLHLFSTTQNLACSIHLFSSFLETNWRIFQKMHFPIIVYHYLQQRERTLHAMQLWCNFSRQQKVPKNLTIFLSKNWQINLFLIFLWYCSPSSATSVSEMLTRQLLYLRTFGREMYIQYIPDKIKEYICDIFIFLSEPILFDILQAPFFF